MCFSNYIFTRWVFYGMWQSVVIILLSFIPFEQQGGSLWLEGNFAYLGIVIIANISVMTATNAHTAVSLIFQIGPILFFMLCSWILNYFKFSVLFGTLRPQFSSIEFYYILLLMLLAIVQVDIGVNYINKKIRQRMIKIARRIKHTLKNMRGRKSTDSEYKTKARRAPHRGFAFDQEPGNAPQIVNRVKNASVFGRKTMNSSNLYSMLMEDQDIQRSDFLSKTYYKKAKDDNQKRRQSTDKIFE